jgi:hypothetical protein
LLPGAHHKLNDPAVREVFVTDTVSVREQNSPQRHVISIAPLIAGALERFLADARPGGDLYNALNRMADGEKKRHATTVLS